MIYILHITCYCVFEILNILRISNCCLLNSETLYAREADAVAPPIGQSQLMVQHRLLVQLMWLKEGFELTVMLKLSTINIVILL